MITPEKLSALEAAALAAVDLPELRCQVAMADIYKTAGLLPMPLAIPLGPRDLSSSSEQSPITEWVEDSGFFEEVAAPAQAGDLLGFRLGHSLHHVSIQLGGGRMVHVYGLHGVKIAEGIPERWAKRLVKIWRLK